MTNVSVVDFAFSPVTVTINVNDAVRWVWAGSFTHSATSDTPLFDSGLKSSGTFTNTFGSAGSFPYHCSVHAVSHNMRGTVVVNGAPNNPPSVTITNPTNGKVLAAPASFGLAASASDSDGSVTNVQFLQGAAVLGNDTTAPYNFSASGLTAGSYTFSAVASDNAGAKATNSISITVVNPVAVQLGSPQKVSAGSFKFSFSANTGLSYVVQRSINFSNWTALVTNLAASNPVVFIDPAATGTASYYRVGRLP